MKKSHRIFITGLSVVTFITSLIIIWILLFHQTAVPKLSTIIQKGDPPTQEQIQDAVDNYFKHNPVRQPQDGKDAPPVSDNQIDRSVVAFLITHPPAQGKTGNVGTIGATGGKGEKGDSCTTTQTETGAVITCEDGSSSFISSGTDGRTPILRCNTEKNRWEIRYSEEDNWAVIKDQEGNSVRCTSGRVSS